MSITLISALDMNNAIGDGQGNLLFSLPKDMAHFKSVTSGKVVVMGRRTWESLNIKPLPKRKNYVLTENEEFEAEGATILHSIKEIMELAKTKDVYVIGGGELYYQLIDDADKLMITHIHGISDKAYVHFPDFGANDWKMIGKPIKNESDENHLHSFTFANYERIKK